MREILFRVKTWKGDWVEGQLVKEVLPETVEQFTGLTDKNGKKIFEGDIVAGRFLHSLPINAVIAFRNGAFGLLWNRAGAETFDAFTSLCNIEYEVIGNIHDNPELLKEA